MKILFISVHGDPLERLGSSQAGGQNNYVRQLTIALEKRNHEIDVATHWNNKKVKETQIYGRNIKVIRIAAGHRSFVKKEHLIDLLPAFFKELHQHTNLSEYDVIHTNYYLSGQIGLMIKDKIGKPMFHTSHSLGHIKARAMGIVDDKRLEVERQILRAADCIIATTQDEKNKIKKFTGSNSNVEVVPIGVGDSFFDGETRTLPDTPRFMFAGRLTQAKGIFVLFQAFAEYIKRFNPNAELIIAGGGRNDFIDGSDCVPKSSALRTSVAGIESSIRFVGPKKQAELAALFKQSTAVIVPSFYESFGMVAAEATATGVPVIASKVGGLKNVVFDGKTGLLFKNKSIPDLLSCMRKLAEDRELNSQLGEQAKQYAAKIFNWESISEHMEALYENARI